jgi:hypothetical protein
MCQFHNNDCIAAEPRIQEHTRHLFTNNRNCRSSHWICLQGHLCASFVSSIQLYYYLNKQTGHGREPSTICTDAGMDQLKSMFTFKHVKKAACPWQIWKKQTWNFLTKRKYQFKAQIHQQRSSNFIYTYLSK